MIQTLYLTMTGDISEEEAFAVRSDKDLSVLRCILRGYHNQPRDTALLRATKPDGMVCYLSGIPEGENAFRFTLTEQMTTVPGDVVCDVSIHRGTGTISSDQFVLKVRPPSAAGEMTQSESEYLGFTDLIINTVDAHELSLNSIDAIWEDAN